MIRQDEAIKKDVVDSIFWDTRVDASTIQVSVDNGRVHLSGKIPTAFSRAAAREDAVVIDGVRSVSDDLRIDYSAIKPSPTDTNIRENIISAIDLDSNLDISDLDIDVNGGWITLEGTTDSYWKKTRAEEVTVNLVGVAGITNKLAVVPSETVLDKVIAEDIVSAIERSLRADVSLIDVAVEDGKVTLSGTVPSLAIARAVERIASFTAGVVEVENRMISGER